MPIAKLFTSPIHIPTSIEELLKETGVIIDNNVVNEGNCPESRNLIGAGLMLPVASAIRFASKDEEFEAYIERYNTSMEKDGLVVPTPREAIVVIPCFKPLLEVTPIWVKYPILDNLILCFYLGPDKTIHLRAGTMHEAVESPAFLSVIIEKI